MPLVRTEAERAVGVYRVEAFLLQPIGAQLVRQTDAAPFLRHVEQDAPALLGEVAERAAELLAAVALEAAEQVARQAGGMNPHRCRIGPRFGGAEEDRDVVEQAARLAEEDESGILRLRKGNRPFAYARHVDTPGGREGIDLIGRHGKGHASVDRLPERLRRVRIRRRAYDGGQQAAEAHQTQTARLDRRRRAVVDVIRVERAMRARQVNNLIRVLAVERHTDRRPRGLALAVAVRECGPQTHGRRPRSGESKTDRALAAQRVQCGSPQTVDGGDQRARFLRSDRPVRRSDVNGPPLPEIEQPAFSFVHNRRPLLYPQSHRP